MNVDDTPDPRIPMMEPEDLNGHTIEQLSDYLEAGRTPSDPSIEQSPGCQIALDALQRLRALTPELFAADLAAEPEADESWIQSILSGIVLDARAGRRIPLAATAPNANLGITEGAVRGLIRAAEHAVPGTLIGKSSFDGDVTVPGEAIRVLVEVSVPYGAPIPALANLLRQEISAQLRAHTTMNVTGIDIAVQDIQQLSAQTEGTQ